MNFVKNLCTPALVYLILVVVGIVSQIMSTGIQFVKLISTIIVASLWTWLLNFICKSGYPIVSWILVFLPFIVLMILLVFLTNMVKNMSVEDKKELVNEIKKKN